VPTMPVVQQEVISVIQPSNYPKYS
jgi:hypothetical protein